MSDRRPHAPAVPEAHEMYRGLRVRRVINAADTYTVLGGGRLPEEVVEAMAAAAGHHVHVDELLGAVGRRIAEVLGVPGAHVVNGAAAGLAVAAAACMAGTDPAGVGLLPERTPTRDQIVVLRCQRNSYDRALVQSGAHLVEVGFADSTPPWALEAAISERTAAVVYYAGEQFERFAPSLDEVARVAHEHKVPVIVDAAAQLPPVSNLRRYLDEGGDLVLFSGGKGLRGPQSTGLIVGTAELIQACAANSYPHHSIGRSMKVSKETALGLLAAVERAVQLDWDAEYRRWEALLRGWAQALSPIAGLRSWIVPTGRLGQTCPRLFLEWQDGPTAGELARQLEALDPSIVIGVDRVDVRQAFLNPYSVLPDEEEHLIEVVHQHLEATSET